MSEQTIEIKLTWVQRLKILWDGEITVTIDNPDGVVTEFMEAR